jgi:hypothetical protein
MKDDEYAIGQACRMLGVDRKTLTKWLGKDGIEPADDKYDGRVRTVTADQLARIAAAHERTVRPPATLADALALIAGLEARIVALEAARQAAYAPVTRYDGQEAGTRPLSAGQRHRPSVGRPAQRSAPFTTAGGTTRNASGEYTTDADGLTRTADGTFTIRAIARICAAHGASENTARLQWAPKIAAEGMSRARADVVRWLLDNKPTYVSQRCDVADCPCQPSADASAGEGSEDA